MSHEIRKSDRFGEVRKNGQRAWHGLGMEIEEGMTAQEGFEKIGLGWRTVLAPVEAVVDVMGPNGMEQKRVRLSKGCRGEDGTESAPMAHLRADNLDLLGMVTDGYKPMENQDLAKFADDLVGADATVKLETAGTLYGGRRVFALVKLPEVIKATADDELLMYVLVSNGHGGHAGFSCYDTSVRVVCANTLAMSERDLLRGLRFRHTGDIDTKLTQARTVLGIARKEAESFEQKVKLLVKTRIAGKALEEWMERLWDKCFCKIDPKTLEKEALDKLLEKRKTIVAAWMANVENERNALKGIRGTAWAAYNAVSEWQDHQRGRFLDTDESDARVASNVFGTSHRQKQKAFASALALVAK